MEEPQLSVISTEGLEGRAYINPADITKLSSKKTQINEFDFVWIQNDYEDWGACQVLISEEIEPGIIAVDSVTLDGANISDGETVFVRKIDKLRTIKQVHLGLEPLVGQPVEACIAYVAENPQELTPILQNRPLFRGLQIEWRPTEIGRIKIHFNWSKPKLDEEEVGIIDPTGKETEILIGPFTEMAFNAILVIDVSSSMQKKDMRVKNVAGAVEGLKKGFKDAEFLEELLIRLQKRRISRIDASILATMLFLSLKIAKGWGEEIQVITFSEDVNMFFLDQPDGTQDSVIRCTGATRKQGIDAIIEYVVGKCNQGSGLTFMSGALNAAYEAIPSFGENELTEVTNPTMIILLTDGSPNKGNGIGINPVPIIEELIEDFPATAMYAIGLGEADNPVLKQLADLGRGEAFFVKDFEELWKWYDMLAQRFQMGLHSEEFQIVE
ncbi:MAG: VWA domain-containing protein [Candidatus Hodarchaeota archaeon]